MAGQNMRRYVPLFGVTLFFVCAPAFSAAGEKTIYDVTQVRRVRAPVFRGVLLGAHLITPEKTTLAQVIALAGPNRVKHSGDASTSRNEICYRFRQDGRMRAVIFASGEVGGGKWITDISLLDDVPAGVCPALSAALSNVSADIRLRLGDRLDLVTARLGRPGGRLQNRLAWAFAQKISGGGTDYDRYQYVDMIFIKARVTWIHLAQVSTN